MPCLINPLITQATCGGMYLRAIQNTRNPNLNFCRNCGIGKQYIKTYIQEHKRLNGYGKCACCERSALLEPFRIGAEVKYMCKLCKNGIKSAMEHGLRFEQVQEEVKEWSVLAASLSKGKKHWWSWEKKEKQDNKKGK